jgi:hypothetical protein
MTDSTKALYLISLYSKMLSKNPDRPLSKHNAGCKQNKPYILQITTKYPNSKLRNMKIIIIIAQEVRIKIL